MILVAYVLHDVAYTCLFEKGAGRLIQWAMESYFQLHLVVDSTSQWSSHPTKPPGGPDVSGNG